MISRSFYSWPKHEHGTAAIEFSLLALPFVLAVVCLLELGMYFANAFVLEGSVMDVSRMIQTGFLQDEAAGDQEEVFADALCDSAGVLLNCGRLQYEVRKLDNFSGNVDPAYNEDGDLDDPEFEVSEIGADCVALIRIAYRYEFMTPLFGQYFGAQGNSRLLMATAVLQVEPYKTEGAVSCTS